MEFRTSTPYTGDGKAALKTARTILTGHGFRVDVQNEDEITATSSGMTSTQQNPLLGVTFARITVRRSTIDVEALLGGVKRMRNFLFFFPPLLCLFLMAVFYALSMGTSSLWTCVLVVLPWVFLSPIMSAWIKRRSIDAVNTLVHNMMSSAEND